MGAFFLFRSFSHTASSEEDTEEWRPPDSKQKAPTKLAGDPSTAGRVKAPAKRTAKPREPKEPRQPKAPKVPREPKPRVPRKAAACRKTQASEVLKDSGLGGAKIKDDMVGEGELNKMDGPKRKTAEERVPGIRMKEEVRGLFLKDILYSSLNERLVLMLFTIFISQLYIRNAVFDTAHYVDIKKGIKALVTVTFYYCFYFIHALQVNINILVAW